MELAELVGDESFRKRVREMAVAGAAATEPPSTDPAAVVEHAGGAVSAGIAPESAAGKEFLDRIVPAGERTWLAEQIDTFTDRRVERFWELMGLINDRPPFSSMIPAFEWVIAAPRAHS